MQRGETYVWSAQSLGVTAQREQIQQECLDRKPPGCLIIRYPGSQRDRPAPERHLGEEEEARVRSAIASEVCDAGLSSSLYYWPNGGKGGPCSEFFLSHSPCSQARISQI